jgi:chromosome partitioning protein
MGKIISVVNQKGGVGKTTTAVSLAASFGKAGHKTLIIDADPQGNTTSGFGVDRRTAALTTYDVLIQGSSFSSAAVPTKFDNVDIIPSSIDLAGSEVELADMERRAFRLKQSLAGSKDVYEFILIDCPPSLGLITINALTASDTLLVPIQCEFYALEGLTQLMATVRSVKRGYNPDIEIEGVLLTMFDSRLNLTIQVTAEVKKHFREKVYKTVIPRNVRLSEAPSHGQPIQYYDPYSRGASSYDELAQEILAVNEVSK